MDLLKLVRRIPGCPPVFREEIFEKLGEKVTVPPVVFPKAAFTSSRAVANGQSLPQAIAHRGHKAACPENTIRAFESAVESGAHAVETDVHLSKDGVVVLSHDADLKRCFGVDRKVADCEWSYLETLRTLRPPHEPLPRLQDLLYLLAKPEWRSIWLLLDIKIDDDPEELMRGLAANFRLVDTHGKFDWKDKVILGFWTVTKHLLPPTLSKSHSGQAKFIPLCNIYFPGFPIVSIGFSPLYFRQFLDVPNTAFNFLTASARSFSGRRLIQDIQTHQRSLFFWTVNDEKNMDWCIRRKADGVVTDDIPKFLKTCETYHERKEPQWSLGGLTGLVVFNFWVLLFGLMFTRRYGSSVTKTMDTKKNR